MAQAGQPIRVGVVGANVDSVDPQRFSWGARAHLPALQALAEFDVVAVGTTRMETAERAARHFGVPTSFDDPVHMMRSAGIDAVVISTHVTTHAELVRAALDLGLAVYCEWPLGATLEETGQLCRLASSGSSATMVGLQARASPTYLHMKALIAAGFVGRPLTCSMAGSMTASKERLAGTEVPRSTWLPLVHAGHTTDLMSHVLGSEIELSTATLRVGPEFDQLVLRGGIADGATADLNIRHVPVPGAGFVFEVNGTEGVLVAALDRTDFERLGIRSLGEQINQATLWGARSAEPITAISVPPSGEVSEAVPEGPPRNVAHMLRRFAAEISDPKRVAFADFDLALRRHRLFSAAQVSRVGII